MGLDADCLANFACDSSYCRMQPHKFNILVYI